MFETALVLIPILIADIVNPVLFAFMVYAAGVKKPVITSSAVLLGHTIAYFLAGLAIALGLERIADYLANPSGIDYALSLIVGGLLLWVAFAARKPSEQRDPEETGDLTPVRAFGLGAVVNFVGIPFALPYFAAVDQVLKADLGVPESLALLAGYNLLYALPFVVVPAMVAVLGERSRPLLQRINALLERASGFLMPILLALVGLLLVVDAVLYFYWGIGLF